MTTLTASVFIYDKTDIEGRVWRDAKVGRVAVLTVERLSIHLDSPEACDRMIEAIAKMRAAMVMDSAEVAA